MSHQLTIEPLGVVLDVADGQTILDASLRAGYYLPHACCHGLCATCKIQVLDGEVDHGEASSFALMDYEREERKCLACVATLQSDVTIEADIDADEDSLNIPVEDYQGVIVRIQDLTPTIKGIWLKIDGGKAMKFQAGQYIDLRLPDGIGARAFSLANPPSTGDEVELNIRIVPGGRGTGWIHKNLHVGNRVDFSGPYGRFFVRKSAALPSIFIGGGSGLSSVRSMILDAFEDEESKPVTLVYGARNRQELYYYDEFVALAERHPNFQYIPVLSEEPADSEWAGKRGFANDALKEAFNGDFRGHKAYLCGPPAMVEKCISTLMQGRLFEDDIYTERFISAADAQQVRSPLFKKI